MAIAAVGEGVVSNLVAKSLEALGKAAMKEAASWWGARGELEKLEKTMRMIQARVCDAERLQEGDSSEAIKEWLRRLRLVLYRAEDLFEEVLYVDHQKQHQKERRSMLCQVGILFSKYGPLYTKRKLANEIKSIRIELDAIKSDMNGLHLSSLPTAERPIACLIEKRETVSFVDTDDVTGREDDQNKIIEMLFDPKYDVEKITVISIVGFGGLGKTTLAQLVFNHVRLKQHFDLTAWTYVPEIGNKKVIMEKILNSFTNKDNHNNSLDKIQQHIRESIGGRKYLLVLDDLWDEDINTLSDLESLLKCGKQGSKVIVTTRSDNIAKYFGPIEVAYKLGTLTDHQSWELFRKFAFKRHDNNNNPALRVIGEEIVKMCRNVPLVIKVVGGSLTSKNTAVEWVQVKNDLSKAQLAASNEIMAALKLSYDYLLPKSKLCFAYCSLFPKGYVFVKDDLVQLWIAQGYVEADRGDQYFWDLVARNLFQGPEVFYEDESEGDVTFYKMHDLLHDLACEVAGAEIKSLGYDGDESSAPNPNELVHVNLHPKSECPSSLKVVRRLRSLLGIAYYADDEKLLLKNQSLRVLSMTRISVNMLPNSMGRLIHLRYLDLGSCYRIKYIPNWIARLIHLRYLDLGWNEIKYLPDCIEGLKNLQALKLKGCKELRELPIDFVKLTNLKHLLLHDNLIDLPPEFGKMTSLQGLNRFIVGNNNGLESLGSCWNYRGKLTIEFHKWRKDAIGEVKMANLKENLQLTSLTLKFDHKLEERVSPGDGEMLEFLQLPPNLKHLGVLNCKVDELPGRWLDVLPQLVSLKIDNCEKCKALLYHLRWLPLLKCLKLKRLNDLEYVEDENNMRCGSLIHNGYFESLQVLELMECYKLKGWTSASKDNVGERLQLVFPNLLKMKVSNCPMLMSMPMAPKLESLDYHKSDVKVWNCIMRSNYDEEGGPSSSTAPPSSSIVFMPLKELCIDDVDGSSLAISSSLCHLSKLMIYNCSELRNMRFESPNSRLDELFISNCEELEMEEDEGKSNKGWQGLTSLRVLNLYRIPKMKNMPRGIFCLTTIEELTIKKMENLTQIPEEIGNLTLLCKLVIENCPKLKSLPPSITGLLNIQELKISVIENLTELPDKIGNDNLPLLRRLEIIKCPRMKTLPRSLHSLTSLQFLVIFGCPELAKRYMLPDGEDCDLIQHIPNVRICGKKWYTRGDVFQLQVCYSG